MEMSYKMRFQKVQLSTELIVEMFRYRSVELHNLSLI